MDNLAERERENNMPTLLYALQNSSRPVFLFGSTPPRDGTSIEKAKETCAKVRNEVCFSQYFIAVYSSLNSILYGFFI